MINKKGSSFSETGLTCTTECIMSNENEHSYSYFNLINAINDIKENEGVPYCNTEDEDEFANENILKENRDSYLTNISWEPKDFSIETTTIWSFPNRGSWATHSGEYRGNCSPYIPRNVILRYSKVNDLVLDQFVGSGTTLIETKLLKRKGIGVDINENSLGLASKNLEFNINRSFQPKLYRGDARNLDFINNESIDLIFTHPPYSNIIKYSKDIIGDLSLCDENAFLHEMVKVAAEAFRILKHGKYCALLIGDIRRNKNIVPLGFRTMQTFLDAGFILKELIIKHQHNCSSTGYWREKSIKYNFLLIAHEYLLIFYKP